MRTCIITVVAVCAGLAATAPGYAAGPGGRKDGIVGQDVLGDTSRSFPDGWSWAPQTRDRAPGGTAPGQTPAHMASAPNARPGSGSAGTLPPGADPGTPATPRASGPGTKDAQ